jgi:hypothetical protein
MSVKVFISYRQNDSAPSAGRVSDTLRRVPEIASVFLDVDAMIRLGENLVAVLEREVINSDVLLVVIGPDWLVDRNDHRPVDDKKDFPRNEIAWALKNDMPIVPLILDNAKMPRADQLPAEIEGFANRKGLRIRHDIFAADMDKLVSEIIALGRRQNTDSDSGKIKVDQPGGPDHGGTLATELGFMLGGLLAGVFLSMAVMFLPAQLILASGSQGRKVVTYAAIGAIIFVLTPTFLILRARLLAMHGLLSYGLVSAFFMCVALIAAYFGDSTAEQLKTVTISVFIVFSSSLGALLMLRLKRQWEPKSG